MHQVTGDVNMDDRSADDRARPAGREKPGSSKQRSGYATTGSPKEKLFADSPELFEFDKLADRNYSQKAPEITLTPPANTDKLLQNVKQSDINYKVHETSPSVPDIATELAAIQQRAAGL